MYGILFWNIDKETGEPCAFQFSAGTGIKTEEDATRMANGTVAYNIYQKYKIIKIEEDNK